MLRKIGNAVGLTSSISDTLPADLAWNVSDSKWKDAPLDTLATVLGDADGSRVLSEQTTQQWCDLLSRLNNVSASKLSKASMSVQSWILVAMNNVNNVNGQFPSKLSMLAKNACEAWKGESRLEFLMDFFPLSDLPQYFSADSILQRCGSQLSVEHLLQLCVEVHSGATSNTSSKDAQKFAQRAFSRCNSKEDVQRAIKKVSGGQALLMVVILAASQRLVEVTSMRDCVMWILNDANLRVEHRQTVLGSLKDNHLSLQQQWELFEVILQEHLRPQLRRRRGGGGGGGATASSTNVSLEPMQSAIPDPLLSTAQLIVDALQPVDDFTVAQLKSLESQIKGWRSPFAGYTSSFVDLCAFMADAAVWELDVKPLQVVNRKYDAAREYEKTLSSACTKLNGWIFNPWWVSDLKSLDDAMKTRTISYLRLNETWLKNFNGYWHLDEDCRRQLRELLGNHNLIKRLLEKDKIITEDALKEPRNLISSIRRKIEEQLGANATVQSALEFSRDTGLPLTGISSSNLERYKILYPVLTKTLPVLRSAGVRFTESTPYGVLFWSGVESHLMDKGNPAAMELKLLLAKCNPSGTLMPEVIEQLEFIRLFCSPTCKPIRAFLLEHRVQLAKLPDVMRKQHPTQLWVANRFIELMEATRPLLNLTSDIEDVLNRCPTGTLLAELVKFANEQAPAYIEKIIDILSTSSDRDLVELQYTVDVVNKQRLDMQLLYLECLTPSEILRDPTRYSFVDLDKGSARVTADVIERCYRSCSIMAPDTCRRMGADHFMKMVSAARYAVNTFARLLYTQRQLILVKEENDAFLNEFIVSRNQIKRKAANVGIGIRQLVTCIRVAADIERKVSYCIQAARTKYPHLSVLNDVEFERIHRCLSRRSTDDVEAKQCAAIIALRMSVTLAEAHHLVDTARRIGVLPIEDVGRPLIPAAAGHVDVMAPVLKEQVVFHDCSSTPFVWTRELLLTYAIHVKRLPRFSEVLIVTSAALDSVREECRFLCQKASSPKGTHLFSLVVACNNSDSMTVVEAMVPQLQSFLASGKTKHPIHVFLTCDAAYFESKLRRACCSSWGSSGRDVVSGNTLIKLAEVAAPELDEAVRGLLVHHVPVTVYDSEEVRQGKSFAIKACQPQARVLAVHTMDLFASLSTMVRRAPSGPYWLELGAVQTQDVITTLFEYFILGGLTTRSGVALVLNKEAKYLLEVPHKSLEHVPGFAMLPRAQFERRPHPSPPPTLHIVDPVCKTEFEHGEVRCVAELKKQAARGGWAASDALNRAIERTAEYVCRPDSNPLIDEAAWESRDLHVPSKPSYYLTWFEEGNTCKPVIISEGATQEEVGLLGGAVKVVDVSASITQDQLKVAFLEGIGVTSTPEKKTHLDGYVVTRHTLMAATRISLQLRTHCCPTVLVGETGCGKTHLINIVRKCLGMELVTIDVHPGLIWELDERVVKRQNAGRLAAETTTANDNARPLKNILNDALAKHGQKPVIIFFDELNNWPQQDIIKALMLDRSHDGITIPSNWCVASACNPYRRAEDKSLVYSVQPRTHPSLRAYAWSFGNCIASEEASIVQTMCSEAGLEAAASAFLVESIPAAHALMREHLPERIISFRDSRRCVRLSKELAPVFTALFSVHNATPLQLSFTAFYLTYIVGVDSKRPLRKIIEDRFPGCVAFFKLIASDFFDKIRSVDKSLRRNETIEETLLVVLLAVFTRTPLIIVGPPGTGKSLAPHLVTEAAAGADGVDTNFGKLPTLIRYNFQCTVTTRPSALDEAFTTAHEIGSQVFAVMIVDELGLADVSFLRPLKVLNKWLDREGCSHADPFPSFVGTTNPLVDRSIMNRCVCLFRQLPGVATLERMIQDVGIASLTEKAPVIAQKVFECASSTLIWNNRFLFGMRDFFALLREGQRLSEECAQKQPPEDVPAVAVDRIVLRCCGYDPIGICGMAPAVDDKKLRTTQLMLLRNALEVPPPRPVMLHAESFASARGILSSYFPAAAANPVFICGRILGMDPGMFGFHIQTIMTCMQSGIPIVLIDAPYLYEALMAVLNGSVVVSGERKLARVAFDGESEYCVVSDSFRVILVVVEGRQLQTAVENSTAFADRFERHYVTHDRYTSAVTDLTQFKPIINALPEILRGPLGNLIVNPTHMKSIVYGFHNAMFRFSNDRSDKVNEERCRYLLRLLHVPVVIQKMRDTGSNADECIAVASKIYEFRRLRPLLMRERFLCAFVTAPGEEIPPSVEELVANLKEHCLGPMPVGTDSDEEDESTDAKRRRRLRQTILEDPTRVVLGPYTHHTPDGLLHLELDQTLTAENARVVIVLRVDTLQASHLLSYPLFALCELIKQLSSPSARVLLVVQCDGDSPTTQVDLHDAWRYFVLDSIQPAEVYKRRFADMKDAVLAQVSQKLDAREMLLAKALHEVPKRLGNNLLHELAKPFEDDARPMADALLRDNNVKSDVGGDRSRGGAPLMSFHLFKAAYDALVSALAWYMGIMSLHRSNLVLLSNASAKFLPSGIDLRATMMSVTLQYLRSTSSNNRKSGKRYCANALVDEMFFGADLSLAEITHVHKTILHPRKLELIRLGNVDGQRLTLASSLHRLWLYSGSTIFPPQVLEKEPEPTLSFQIRFLQFVLQQSQGTADITSYLKEPAPRRLIEDARTFFVPLEDVASCETVLSVDPSELKKLAAPRWVRSLLTTFGGSCTIDLATVPKTAATPSMWPQEIMKDSTQLDVANYAIIIARHFPGECLTSALLPAAADDSTDKMKETGFCGLPIVFTDALCHLARGVLDNAKLRMHTLSPGERQAATTKLFQDVVNLYERHIGRDTTLLVDVPREWVALVDVANEAQKAGDPGEVLALLVPAAYCLHEFLQSSFTSEMLQKLTWLDAPLLVRENCPLDFSDTDALYSVVWPQMIDTLNRYVGSYNTLCKTFFERVLSPQCSFDDEEVAPLSSAAAAPSPPPAPVQPPNRYFVVPPVEISVPMDRHSELLSVTPWTPMLRWSDLVQAAWLASKTFIDRVDQIVLDDANWSTMDFGSMVTLSFCRDMGLGLKTMTVVVAIDPENAIRPLPSITIANVHAAATQQHHASLPPLLRAACPKELLNELLANTDLRLELRRNAAAMERGAVDMLAEAGTTTERAVACGERPFSYLATLFENEQTAVILRQMPPSVQIKHLYEVFRAIFAADSC